MLESRRIAQADEKVKGTGYQRYYDSFKLECRICNPTHLTIGGHLERIGYLIEYLRKKLSVNNNCLPKYDAPQGERHK